MSLAIDASRVVAVLVGTEWLGVVPGTFTLDSFEFTDDDGDLIHGGGASGVCATGFSFMSKGGRAPNLEVCGPLTAVLAVKLKVTP